MPRNKNSVSSGTPNSSLKKVSIPYKKIADKKAPMLSIKNSILGLDEKNRMRSFNFFLVIQQI